MPNSSTIAVRRFMLAALLLGTATPAISQTTDELYRGFEAPPQSARPRVWWHWMNGNISKEGIKLDLEWMKRVGIGGMQNFDANLGTPKVVERRLPFMTPEWKDAFRYSATLADQLGLEMAIAASPGWSETGGPWIAPQQAMKKVVWSETLVEGRSAGPIRLPQPPTISGPFKNIPAIENARAEATDSQKNFYVDTQVVAYRLPADSRPLPTPSVTSSAGTINGRLLGDGDIAQAIDLPMAGQPGQAWIRFDYARPQRIQSITLGLLGARGFGAPPAPTAWLEASNDGKTFRTVADLPPRASLERSTTFAPVTAKSYRLVIEAVPGPRLGDAVGAPGSISRSFPPLPTAFQVSELALHPEARVNDWEEKAGFAAANDYYAVDTPSVAKGSTVPRTDVIDLTGKMRADGTLDWKAPPGRWAVLRLGYSLTGKRNHPASPEATGLEVDKLNATHVKAHLDHYLGMYQDAAGPDMMGKKGVRALLTDSIESLAQNWTEDLLGEFFRRRGYDARPWLPTLTGVIVDDAQATDRFLYDWRLTISDLVTDAHYKQVADSAHERGMIVYGEALESRRPQLGNDISMRRYADVPMAAMWADTAGGSIGRSYMPDDWGAASVAHVYGQNIAAAESLTSAGWPWAFAPNDLKSTADLELALGINRFVLHTSIHQPLIDKKPGLALNISLGQYFNRNETWAEQADAWISYLARSSYMLQQGRFVADVAYFFGEEAPLTALYEKAPPADRPIGRGFDFIDPDGLLQQLSVTDGWLTARHGMRYRVLYLGGSSQRMTLAALRRVEALADAGATVVGEKPTVSPNLTDNPAAFRTLADRLWSDAGSAGGSRVGKGAILSGRTVDAALDQLGLARDVDLPGLDRDVVMSVHRHTDDADIYFLSNRTAKRIDVSAAFRVTGRAPERWRAEDASRERLSYRSGGGRTVVPLTLESNESTFVVFREPTTSTSYDAPIRQTSALKTLDGAWTVRFQEGRGAPASATFQTLAPWNENADAGIRYFSGIGTYARTFKADRSWLRHKVELDLGEVKDLAEVWLNGRKVGTAWHAPYRIDLTPALKAGTNRLEIKVVNLWVNRLIGDAQPGAQKLTFTTGPTYSPDAPLRRSGLIGPVRLVEVQDMPR